MNILIVDDEYFAHAALEKLVRDYFIERKRPFSCAVFDHSKKALEYLNEHEIDLVMTDIRMSEMDGLELALQIQEMKNDTEAVLISGYAEFTYAQTALKYNVVDYLLKPISRSQIYECLDKRVETYDKKCEHKVHMLSEKRHALFHQITSSKEITAEQLLSEPDKKEYDQVVMVLMRCSKSQKDYMRTMETRKGIVSRSCENPKGNVVLFIYYGIQAEIGNLGDRVIKHCNMCYKNQKEEVGDALLFAISLTQNISTPLYELYCHSQYAMNGILIDANKYLFEYSKLSENWGYEGIKASSLEYELKQLLEFKDIVQAKKIIHKQIKGAVETKNPSLSQLFDTIMSLAMTINKIVNDYNYQTKKEVKQIPETLLSQFSSIEEIQEYFSCHMERIYHELFLENPVQSIVDQLVQYVHEHYFLNISLTDISKNVLFLNPSYVSRLFTSQMKISFSKYLLNYRLKKAMQCIQNDRDISVQEVAKLTGFYDCSYFVKQFKRQYGQTPGYYQKYIQES